MYNDFEHLDIRIVILPGTYGTTTVLRLLEQDTSLNRIENLNFPQDIVEHYKKLLDENNRGMYLFCGGNGTGKTTSIFATINHFTKNKFKSIITLEDPVEYELHGATQIQIENELGMTFELGLKNILRANPDIIVVGEIRDEETAKLAYKASLTGHIVFTTLHTKNSSQAIQRLLSLNVDVHSIVEGTNVIISQLLIKKLCDCKRKIISDKLIENHPRLKNLSEIPDFFHEAKGCPICNFSGYYGRMPIIDYLYFNNKVKELILSGQHEKLEQNLFFNMNQTLDILLINGVIDIKQYFEAGITI
jgi:type IV pilus assembly protein PilB